MKASVLSAIALAVAVVLRGSVALGADQLILGRKVLIRNPPSGTTANKIVHLAKDATITVGAAGGAGDPQCTGAGGGGTSSLRIAKGGVAGDVTIPLPCGGWTTNDANDLYKYRDATGATCKIVVIKNGALAKAVCKGTQVALDLTGSMAPLGVVTTVNTERYCTQFGGTVAKSGADGRTFLAKDAPSPAACASPAYVFSGDDNWVNPASAGSAFDFSANPVPAGFFDPNSDPFTGAVALEGSPLLTSPPNALGSSSSIIRHQGGAYLAVGAQAIVPIEFIALSLVSVNPITVTYNGGMNPESWDVKMALSAVASQQGGTMTITRTVFDGGTSDASVPLLPRFLFTRQSDSALRTLDCGSGSCGPFMLQSTGSPWVLVNGPGGYDRSQNGIVTTGNLVPVDGDGDGSFDQLAIGPSNFQGGVDAATETCVLTTLQSAAMSLGLLPGCSP